MIEVAFMGRKNGAIGIRYMIKEWVTNDPIVNEMACREELAAKYEHVGQIKIVKPKYKFFLGSP